MEQEPAGDENAIGLATVLGIVGLVAFGMAWLLPEEGSVPVLVAILYRIGGYPLAWKCFVGLGVACLAGSGYFVYVSRPRP